MSSFWFLENTAFLNLILLDAAIFQWTEKKMLNLNILSH